MFGSAWLTRAGNTYRPWLPCVNINMWQHSLIAICPGRCQLGGPYSLFELWLTGCTYLCVLAVLGVWLQIVTYLTKDRFKQNRKKTFKGHNTAGYACQVNFSPDAKYVLSGECWWSGSCRRRRCSAMVVLGPGCWAGRGIEAAAAPRPVNGTRLDAALWQQQQQQCRSPTYPLG